MKQKEQDRRNNSRARRGVKQERREGKKKIKKFLQEMSPSSIAKDVHEDAMKRMKL